MAKRATGSGSSNSGKPDPKATKASVATGNQPPSHATVAKAPAPVRGPDAAQPAAPALGRAVTADQIAKRAYEIYRSGAPGTQTDHWLQAERELKGT